MKVYTVTSSAEYNVTLDSLFGNGSDENGPRIFARSDHWAKGPDTIQEGELGTLDLDANDEGATLLVEGMRTSSALFYLYLDPKLEERQGITAALAFHSPAGTRRIKMGKRKGDDVDGPIAEAKRLGQTVKPANVKVIIAAGPDILEPYKSLRGKPFSEKAQEEHDSLLTLLVEEKIPQNNILLYCSSQGLFGLNADGFIGERAPMVRMPAAPKKRKRCYISTATCASLGLGDDCAELELLRWYRDTILLTTPEGQRDVETYYATAPGIVEAIDARQDAPAIYQEIFQRSLAPALLAIRSGDFERAYQVYREMVTRLQSRFRTP